MSINDRYDNNTEFKEDDVVTVIDSWNDGKTLSGLWMGIQESESRLCPSLVEMYEKATPETETTENNNSTEQLISAAKSLGANEFMSGIINRFTHEKQQEMVNNYVARLSSSKAKYTQIERVLMGNAYSTALIEMLTEILKLKNGE